MRRTRRLRAKSGTTRSNALRSASSECSSTRSRPLPKVSTSSCAPSKRRRVIWAWHDIAMPSFDIVSQVDQQEVKNAIEQANKEIANRYDFKGSDARIEHKELELNVFADDDFKLGQVMDVLRGRLAKRNVDPRYLDPGTIEKISGDKIKQPIKVKVGIEQEKAKGIVKLIKESKLKVAGSIQGDAVRISGAKKDDLQAAIQLVRKSVTDLPLQFINFRD